MVPLSHFLILAQTPETSNRPFGSWFILMLAAAAGLISLIIALLSFLLTREEERLKKLSGYFGYVLAGLGALVTIGLLVRTALAVLRK